MTTVHKALGLLAHFDAARPEIGLTELRRLSGHDKGSVHRWLRALEGTGMVEQNAATRAWRLGPAVLRYAALREATVPMAATAERHVRALAAATGELAHAALPQAGGMSALAHADGARGGIRVGFDPAALLPYHATSSGLAMLAFGAARAPADLARHTEATPVTAEALAARIEETRRAGHAASAATFEAGVHSLAVPFFAGGDRAAGTLAIAAPAPRMDAARLRPALLRAATDLTTDLGGAVPPALAALWTKETTP